MNTFEIFISFLLAFIVKDFYDIFLRNPIISLLSKYKILITPKNKKRWKNGNKTNNLETT